jgi:CubicO group peptidase (beta-lactamase class C family)
VLTLLKFLWRLLCLATAYKAKLLCSGMFVSQRSPASLLSQDLAVDELFLLRLIPVTLDMEAQTVTASVFGLARRTALHRPGLGSTLVIGTTVEALKQQTRNFIPTPKQTATPPAPQPFAPQCTVFQTILDRAFAEPNRHRRQRTRAVVIAQAGKVIAERYAPGFTTTMPLLGWSMAKSAVNALVGILVHQGKLTLDQGALLPEWDAPGDPRRQITLDQLLRMRSGLQFEEVYSDPRSHVTTMLFQRGDVATYAADLPLTDPTGAWSYASGTTNILCRIIRRVVGEDLGNYWAFPRQALFEPLGMTHAILEPDAAGTFVGSSFMYATARDWCKLGQLYLQDGRWQEQRLLPEGWVQYSITPSDPAQRYGAHFWRQVPLSFASQQNPKPILPADTVMASGYQGQILTIIPSLQLVVVRLGLSQRRHSWDHEQFIADLVEALTPNLTAANHTA